MATATFRELPGSGICRDHRLPAREGRKSVALSFQDVTQSKYLLLTTFTKDRRPKPTPF
jgi:hypothetical protein